MTKRIIAASLLLVVLAAVTATAQAPAPRRGGTLRVALRAEASTLDPHRGGSGTDHMWLYPIYDTLVRFDPNMNPVPGLAESWETPDPKTLVFNLRKGLKFHDGTPLDAQAVKYNITRGQDKKMPINIELTAIETVEAVDATRVRLKLKRPDASLILSFADRSGMMVSPAAVEKHGEQFGRNPVGAGEFKFVRWTPGDSVRVERFTDFWDKGKPYLDAMLLKSMPDGDTRLNALRSGQVDFVMEIPQQDFDGLKAERGLVTHSRISLAYWRLFLNTSKAPLDKKAVREAIALSIDRPAILKTIAFGLGELHAVPFPSAHWAHNPAVKTIGHDVAKAKAKLAEAGLPNGFTLEMVVEAAPEHVRRAEALQAQLAQSGIKVDLKPVELVKGVNMMFRTKEAMSANFRWTGRPDPDQSLRGMFHSTGFWNTGQLKVAKLEELMDAASSTYKLDERKKLYAQIGQIIQEEALDPGGLFFAPALEAAAGTVQGYQPNLLGKPIFRNVWLTK
jgi:peptide/nickel transport system substrate-binding protein